jgi:hypothetical protein
MEAVARFSWNVSATQICGYYSGRNNVWASEEALAVA